MAQYKSKTRDPLSYGREKQVFINFEASDLNLDMFDVSDLCIQFHC